MNTNQKEILEELFKTIFNVIDDCMENLNTDETHVCAYNLGMLQTFCEMAECKLQKDEE